MRVLYVHHVNTISGAGISLATLLRYIEGETRAYFWLHRSSQLAATLGAAPERTYRDYAFALAHTTRYGARGPLRQSGLHLAKSPVALPTLKWLQQRFRPDLLHLNETVLVAQAAAASLLGIPTVMHARTVVDPGSPGMRVLERIAARGSLRLVAVDPETRASLPPHCQARSEVIYNPVDLKLASPEAARALRRAWHIPDDGVLVGQVGSLHTEKGIWRILELARRLCPRLPQVHFALVGDDRPQVGEGEALRRAVAEAGLSKRVHLVGHHADLGCVYGALDVVLCMFGEHLRAVGRTAYEAPLAARPLIATVPNPETCRSVQHGVTGWAFDPADLRGVEDAIATLVGQPARRVELGERARLAIGDRHDPVQYAARVRRVYSALLAGRDG